jgi:glycyl-tRNA synthetase beta chain
MADFLLEIGTEEIPAPMIPGLQQELARRIMEGLEAARLPASRARAIAAPRRIGLLVEDLQARQADRRETVAGPAMAVALGKDGGWTQAALGFARKQGVAPDKLREVPGPKGPCVGFEREVPGRPAAEVLSEVVPPAVDALHLPKAMRWGDGSQIFVRPVRWVVALLDGDVVPMAVKGIASGRASRGHRIHGAPSVVVKDARSYFDTLASEKVLADPEARRGRIRSQLEALAAQAGGRPSQDPELLETVAFLCEYPTVIAGEIPPEYLTLPSEILVTCLREHQKFFVVLDGEGNPLPRFLSVVDAVSDPQGLIRRGNENVSVSRLADARFFYEHDRKVDFGQRLEELKGIVFHPKLGTYYDKALRMEALAGKLAALFGADQAQAAWAAKHSKCDLASLLVQEKEFTSLQGIAGGLFAKAQGKSEAVWQALYDQYRPLSTEDDLPRGPLGAVVALADKLDTLVEMFRIGQAPSGSKDPFALRRAGMGVLRILLEKGLSLDLAAFLASRERAAGGLQEFLLGRLRFLWEGRGFPYDEINAVLGFGMSDPLLLDRKLKALHAVRTEFPEDFDHLSVAFKRVKNILKGIPAYPLDPARFLSESSKEGAGERALHEAYEAVKDEAGSLLDRGEYAAALRRLSTVRPAVDKFFDDVLVMCDPEGKDPEKSRLQQNRLALLQRLVALFNRVADFSEIVPKNEG